jgi:signal transduction histidine kinase
VKHSLRGRLTRFLLAAALVSGLTALLLTNAALYRTFYNYKEAVQLENARNFAEFAANTYELTGGWSPRSLSILMAYPDSDQFSLIVFNENDQIVFSSQILPDNLNTHRMMMRRMGRNAMLFQPKFLDGTQVVEDIMVSGQKVGTLELNYPSTFSVDTAELDFTSSVNRSLLISLAVALSISALLSGYLSKILARPIVKLTEVTKSIRNGHFQERAQSIQSVRELTELSGAINTLAETLSHQSEIRKRLTSDLAHELRTPLTIIQGQLDAILEGLFEPTPERLLVARSETERLIGLVERLREIADLEDDTVQLTCEEFDLTDLVRDAAMLFEADAQTRSQQLVTNLEPDLTLIADPHRLRQVMVNLLSNAVKYTPEGGQIQVRTYRQEHGAVLEVTNTGPGIAEADLPYLFDRFYRADVSRHRDTGGSGIGLTVVKLIVDAHHGRIDIKSVPNQSTTFSVYLPLRSE